MKPYFPVKEVCLDWQKLILQIQIQNGGVAILLKKSLLVNLITFLANNSTCSRSANIVISTTYYY